MNSLLAKSFSYAFKNSIPLMATLEITQDCNFSCSHCYNFDRTKYSKPNHDNKREDLTHDEFLNVIDNLNKLGTLIVNFSGGESSLASGIYKYIERCVELHMEPRLKSNGALLTDRVIDLLVKAGLKGLDISMYGFSEETYQNFTRTKNGFDRTVTAIKKAKASGLEVIVSIILHKENVKELDEMVNFCKEMKIQCNIGTEMTKRYDGSTSSLDYQITDEQFMELLNGPYKSNFEHSNEGEDLQCSCARSIIGINVKGDVYPCIGAPIPSGNVKEKGLVDIWKNSPELNKIRNIKKSDFTECNTCEYIKTCSRSSGSAYINTGNYTGCEPATLRQAKIRKDQKLK